MFTTALTTCQDSEIYGQEHEYRLDSARAIVIIFLDNFKIFKAKVTYIDSVSQRSVRFRLREYLVCHVTRRTDIVMLVVCSNYLLGFSVFLLYCREQS